MAMPLFELQSHDNRAVSKYDLWYLLSVITTFLYQMVQMNESKFLIINANYRNVLDTNSAATNIPNVFPSVTVRHWWTQLDIQRFLIQTRKALATAEPELEFIWKTSKQAKTTSLFSALVIEIPCLFPLNMCVYVIIIKEVLQLNTNFVNECVNYLYVYTGKLENYVFYSQFNIFLVNFFFLTMSFRWRFHGVKYASLWTDLLLD